MATTTRMSIAAMAALAVGAAFAEGDATLTEGWRFAKDPSCKADWSAEALDDSAWQRVRVPHDWAIAGPFTTNEASGITGRLPWKGVGWYRLRDGGHPTDRSRRACGQGDVVDAFRRRSRKKFLKYPLVTR